ncbi:hypothetical protein EIP91_000207 [Steccherinum ochraceum]|uniref:Uncharacterized protein n=1 Tax=Steccherinum ochraceum TaxID=92696 RepID=A0A4R0RUB6_9APHY|nr:hypothetical protein EIP91_000207 [Steccherinum ochraceum]
MPIRTSLLPQDRVDAVPVCSDDPFYVLYQRIWNTHTTQTRPNALTEVIQIPAVDDPLQRHPCAVTYCEISPLPSTIPVGKVMARQEYWDLREFIRDCFVPSTTGFSKHEAVVIVGSPKQGKTAFLYFHLFWNLCEGTPCILQTSRSEAYFFGPHGVHLIDLNAKRWQFGPSLRELGCPETVQVLCDSDDIEDRVHPSFTTHSTFYIRYFVVQVTEPRSSRYHALKKIWETTVRYVQTWSWPEIYAAGVVLGQRSYEELAAAYAEFGPVPGLCLLALPVDAQDRERQRRRSAASHLATWALESTGTAVLMENDLDETPTPYPALLLSSIPQSSCFWRASFTSKIAAYEFFDGLSHNRRGIEHLRKLVEAKTLFEMVAHSHFASGTPLALRPLTEEGGEELKLTLSGPIAFLDVHRLSRSPFPVGHYCILHSCNDSESVVDALWIQDQEVYLFKMTREKTRSIRVNALAFLMSEVKKALPTLSSWRLVFVVPRGMASDFKVEKVNSAQRDTSGREGDALCYDPICEYVVEFDMSCVGSMFP